MVQDNDPQEANENKNKATPVQQRKQDALELAELIYNIFHYGLSSATIGDKDGKDNQND